MPTTDALLRAAVSGAPDALSLTLDSAFQGLPETAHGGTLLALFDTLARRGPAREIVGHYRRRVPLGTPLGLAVGDDGASYRVLDAVGAVLVEGRVETLAAAPPAAASPPAGGEPLPISRTCFACGVDNPIGLRAALTFDQHAVGGEWRPHPRFLREDGRLSAVALTTLLDEAAFWLGALATGESGMTTELRVTLHEPAAAPERVRVSGERRSVRPRVDDPRYWETRVAATDERGRLLASGAITFVTVRGAARRLVSGLLASNETAVLRRVFPAYTA